MFRKIFFICICGSLCFFVLHTQGYASFRFVEKAKAQNTHKRSYKNISSGSYRIMQIGSGNAEIVSNFGTDLSLRLALSMVVPQSWHVEYSDKIKDKGQNVSWRIEDEPWINALREMKGYKFIVDWDNKNLYVGKSDEDNLRKKAMSLHKNTDTTQKQKKHVSSPESDKRTAENSTSVQVFKKEKEKPEAGVVKKGNLEQSIKKYFSKYGYKLIVRKDFSEELWLSSPIHMPGTGLLDDLNSLNKSLQTIKDYDFKFSQYKKNKYIVLDVKGI